MKKDSFWDSFTNYMKFRAIVPVIILIVLAIALIAKTLFNKIIG
ncbi:hypothetical protein [Psychroserpens luteus]|jgi:hypothetical protein|uniref:Uncharacterized protein n=1 Tax=Psychroserpens luteus TaxID=1434066 RepID=A0ABW5ZY94_9FLAO|nr:hypothetical protein [Psychroserpens luteus]